MRFGIYVEMQCPPDKSHHQLTREILDQIVHADACGFSSYATVEHFFFQEFGISANPLAMFAAAAQRTRQIRFRTALHVVPLHNPLVLASQIAEAVLLTEGRLDVGLGRGHAWLYKKAGIPLEESRPRYEEALQIIELAWREPKFSFSGRFWDVEDVTVNPRLDPFPPPQIWTGGTSPSTYAWAGARGWGIGVPPLLPYGALREGLDAYASAARQAGHEPRIMYMRPVYVEDDPEVARREYEEHLKRFIRYNAVPVYSLHEPAVREELTAKGFGFYASGAGVAGEPDLGAADGRRGRQRDRVRGFGRRGRRQGGVVLRRGGDQRVHAAVQPWRHPAVEGVQDPGALLPRGHPAGRTPEPPLARGASRLTSDSRMPAAVTGASYRAR
jgi:alkanesulfonate monooxygenase SsuD/methylene tetrahydromethanopterin reductase-like flavin-dependent oxidoreductase (luciferase family)